MVSREEKSDHLVKTWKLEEERKKNRKRIFKIIIIFIAIFSLILGIFCYMRFYGTKKLEVREYRVVSKNLPSSFHGLKIIHFSDLHYNSTVNEKDLIHMVEKINELKPDIVVFSGDLTDQDTKITEEDQNVLVKELNKIKAPLGLYTVRGNHDYATSTFDIVFNQTSFKILDNNYELIYKNGTEPLLLVGLGSSLQNDFNLDQAFQVPTENTYYTIGLFHEPDQIDEILKDKKINLALAGHSHNGQIRLPEIGAITSVKGAKKYPNEHYIINNTELFVSGGLGTSIYKLRFFNHPSINLYRVVEK